MSHVYDSYYEFNELLRTPDERENCRKDSIWDCLRFELNTDS